MPLQRRTLTSICDLNLWTEGLVFSQNFECYRDLIHCLNPLSVNPTKCSNTLKQFVGNLTIGVCLTILWGWR